MAIIASRSLFMAMATGMVQAASLTRYSELNDSVTLKREFAAKKSLIGTGQKWKHPRTRGKRSASLRSRSRRSK